MIKSHKLPAFSLIEVLVVATILILLTTIGVASFRTANQSARDAKRKSDMETIRQALVLWRAQEGHYGGQGNYAGVMTLLTGGVASDPTATLSQPTPLDPVNSAPFVYTGFTSMGPPAKFCVCAKMDDPSKGNQTANDCSGTWSSTSGAFYCVQQP